MHHPDDVWTRQTRITHTVEQVGRHIGIARRAVAESAASSRAAIQLHDEIDATIDEIARDMRVVHARVVALRRFDAEHRPRLQIELLHADVSGQR